MIRNLTQYFLLILIVVVAFSCKKEDKDPDPAFPQDLFIANVLKKSEVRVFTNQTEVTDSATKARFINNVTNFNVQDQQRDINEKVRFLSADTAVFTGSDEKFFIARSNDKLLFYSKFPFEDRAPALLNEIVKYPAPKTGGPDGNTRREIRVGHGDYENLSVSVMSYKLTRGDGKKLVSGQYGTFFNEFNEGVIRKLGVNDTLAVQEFKIVLR